MWFKQRRILLFSALLTVCSLSTQAQFTGGDGSGVAVFSLMPSTCPLITYPAIFSGGNEQGPGSSATTQSTCNPIILPSIFFGGQDAGSGQLGLTQSSCNPVVLPSIFNGGTEDGYSYAGVIQSNCSPPLLPSIYAGGASNVEPGVQLNAGCAPLAAFSASPLQLCVGDTALFTDLSSGGPTSWSWSFPGGTPSGSTDQNPWVVYDTPGTYNVTLAITAPLGNNSVTYTAYISVGTPPAVSLSGLPYACLDESPYTLSGGTPLGGTYSGDGVTGGTFDPALAGSGSHVITYTYTDISGCSNSDTSSIEVFPLYDFLTTHQLCAGDTFLWRGTPYTTAGTYTEHYVTVHGCDSTYQLVLTVQPVYAFTENHIICSGGSYTWQGNTYAFPGTYTETYSSVGGCDSTYTLNLSVRPSYDFTESHAMCFGGSYAWHGNTYTSAGTYTLHYSTLDGCDSTYTLVLTEYPIYNFTENHSLCAGDSYTWQGSTYNTSGTYTAAFTSSHGCDSIYTLHLDVHPVYFVSTNADICLGEVYHWFGSDYSVGGTYTHQLYSQYGCDSTFELVLAVNSIDVSLTVNDPIITANAIADTYQWLDCNNGYAPISGEISQSFTALTNGDYAVALTQGLCSDTSACVQILTVGIADLGAPRPILYPNPSDGSFFLELHKDAKVELFNALGSCVFNSTLPKGRNQVQLSLADGVYWVSITQGTERITLKMVIRN